MWLEKQHYYFTSEQLDIANLGEAFEFIGEVTTISEN